MAKARRYGGTEQGPDVGDSLLRGRRIVVRDGAIELAGTDGGVPDTVIRRASGGGLSTPGAQAIGGDLTVTGAASITGTVTAFGYLGVGGNAGVAGALDVAGSCAGMWGPRDNSLLGYTYDPVVATSTQLLTGGSIYLARIPIARTGTPTKLYWNVTTQATTATAGQCWVSVLSSAGAILATPVDVATASETTGLKTTTVAPGALTAGTWVWGAIVLAGSTVATLSRTAAPTGPLAAGMTTAEMRFSINGTAQTTITARTPANNTAGPSLWMALGE